MINADQEAIDQAAFAAAFDEDMTTESSAPEEDEEAQEAELTEDDVVAEEAQPQAEEAPAEPVAEEVMDDKEAQRRASWEGRLKAREAELARREAEIKEREAQAVEEAAKSAKPANSAKPEELPPEVPAEAEVDEGGEVLAALAEDFGDDFAKNIARLIKAEAAKIAGKTVEERVGKVSQTLDKMTEQQREERMREHFEMISDAHPDWMEVSSSNEFKAYIDSLEDEKAEKAKGVVQAGTARQVIRLFNDYKKAQNATKRQEVDETAVSGAEGVRSRSLKLPEKPAISNDYEAAWSQF